MPQTPSRLTIRFGFRRAGGGPQNNFDIDVTTTFKVTLGPYPSPVPGAWTIQIPCRSRRRVAAHSCPPSATATAFQSLTAFDFTVGPGTYTLDFVPNNRGDPFALRVADLSVSAVPEPPIWDMIILGFAGVGFRAYRRHPGVGPNHRLIAAAPLKEDRLRFVFLYRSKVTWIRIRPWNQSGLPREQGERLLREERRVGESEA